MSAEDMRDITHVFVYGTLKRGEVNHEVIEPFALDSVDSTVGGALYDVGPWPALTEGNDSVHGELVRIEPAALPHALRILDRLEGYDPADEAGSLYVRRATICRTAAGTEVRAWLYIYTGSVATLTRFPGGVWPPSIS